MTYRTFLKLASARAGISGIKLDRMLRSVATSLVLYAADGEEVRVGGFGTFFKTVDGTRKGTAYCGEGWRRCPRCGYVWPSLGRQRIRCSRCGHILTEQMLGFRSFKRLDMKLKEKLHAHKHTGG